MWMQALLAIEGLIHPRAAPLRLRVGTVADSKPDDAALTLGQPRFWSADTPPLNEAAADGAEAEVADQEEAGQGGSAQVGSSADAPHAAAEENRQEALAAASRAKGAGQPGAGLAAFDSVAAAGHEHTLSGAAAEAYADQPAGPALSEEQTVRSRDLVGAAAPAQAVLASFEARQDAAQPVLSSTAGKVSDRPSVVEPSIFQDAVESDSEGPMPSIDSGPSDSESAE